MRYLASALVLCGCSHNAPTLPPDAAHHDAPVLPIDAPVFLDAPAMATGTHYHYVADHVFVPTNNTQARAFGLDLNGDGTVDNQLGMVLGTLSGMGFNVQGQVTTAVDTGTMILLADVQTSDFTNASAVGFTTYQGTNPVPPACSSPSDTVCRHHLTGSGSFTVPAASPHDTPLVGSATAGTFACGPGHLPIELPIASSTPLQIELIGARVKLTTVSATGIMNGIIGGAVTQTDINTKVIPALQQSMVPIIQTDCCGSPTSPGGATCNPGSTGTNPNCGCVSGSQGATLLALFDSAPKDCTVSVAEIQNNALVQSLLAPDVTIEGMPALSLGVEITAVDATYTP